MLAKTLNNYHIILASGSPRRQELMQTFGVKYSIMLRPVDEIYPKHLQGPEITDYLAQLKSEPFKADLKDNDVLITSDTIVWHNNKALGKPKDQQDAFTMLQSLSGKTHEVFSSICVTTTSKQITDFECTKVTFKELSDEEIWYYVKNYNCLDKAGAYGIQDWIGQIAVTKLEGSYFNVMGLPTHLLYKTLIDVTSGD